MTATEVEGQEARQIPLHRMKLGNQTMNEKRYSEQLVINALRRILEPGRLRLLLLKEVFNMTYRTIKDYPWLLIDVNQPTTIIHQPMPETGIHRSEITPIHSKRIQTMNLKTLRCETLLRLLNPKQKLASRMYCPLDQHRALLLEMVSLHYRCFYCYLSFEGLTGATQSSHLGAMETPQSTPGTTNRTGYPTELVNGGRNFADINFADISSPRYSQVPRGDLRQRAKAVLKELYPLKIGFLELVKEGIEPKLLAELYAEIGIQIPPSSPQYKKANGTEPSHRGKGLSTLDHIESQPMASSTLQITSPQQNRDNASKDSLLGDQVRESLRTTSEPIPRDSQSGTDQSCSFPKKITVPQNQTQGEPRTQIPNPTVTQTSTATPKPTPSGKLAKAPATTILGKSTIAKSGEKALERKDYIARMLAAKAGKPIPALSTPHITENATNQPQEILSKPVSPKQVSPDDEQRLLIENLSYRATELDLEGFFSAFPT